MGLRMIASLEFLEQKHRKYIMKDCVLEPNFLIHDLVDALPKGSGILDLGCGQGQDTVSSAAHSYQVTAPTPSAFALSHFPDRAPELGVESLLLDLREIPCRFTNDSFDAVCAHLSLHYFPMALTKTIFAEIARRIR